MNRLFEILYLLLDRKQMTAKELADHFEVSQRTIYRDIDKLSLAGVPVYMTKGKHGGISLMQDFVLNKALLNDAERTEIIASLQAVNSVQMTEGQAIDKIKAMFGKTEMDWIEIAFSNWGKEEQLEQCFEACKQAILSNHVVTFFYMNAKGERLLRRVRPAKLCFRGQAWYLYGYCMERQDYRFFKLLRMEEITVCDECFEPVNIGKVLELNHLSGRGDHEKQNKMMKQDAIKGTKDGLRTTILIKAPMAYRAYDELPGIKPQKNGDVICEMQITDLNWFYHYVLSFGANCIVLEPCEIQKTVQNMLRDTLAQYEKQDRVCKNK